MGGEGAREGQDSGGSIVLEEAATTLLPPPLPVVVTPVAAGKDLEERATGSSMKYRAENGKEKRESREGGRERDWL
jgi:hypothetical protein